MNIETVFQQERKLKQVNYLMSLTLFDIYDLKNFVLYGRYGACINIAKNLNHQLQ